MSESNKGKDLPSWKNSDQFVRDYEPSTRTRRARIGYMGANTDEKRLMIMRDLEEVIDAAFQEFVEKDIKNTERLAWGRLIVSVSSEMSKMLRDEMLEKSREDIEGIKAVLRFKGFNL